MMPMPTPRRAEQRKDFLARCMGNPVMVADFDDEKQRYAVCASQWSKSTKAEETEAETIVCECGKCLSDADVVLQAGTYWRPMTYLEQMYGDIPRVEREFGETEEVIAKRAAPVLKKMVKQLLEEAVGAAKSGDPTAAGKLRASFTGELSAAFKAGMKAGVRIGKRQMLDAHKAQVRQGTSLAERKAPRKDPKKVDDYLGGRAEVDAGNVARAVEGAVQGGLMAQMARTPVADLVRDLTNPEGDFYRQAMRAGERSLIASSTMEARESVGMGRLVGWEEVKEDADYVVYSAVMDGNVCDVCAEMDGNEYGPADFGKAPNDECEGGIWGNECRCIEIVIYRNEGETPREWEPVAPPISVEARERAEVTVDRAHIAEPPISADIVEVTSANGMGMEGFVLGDPENKADFRFKTEESAGNKIDEDVRRGEYATKAEAQAGISDALRYTAVAETEEFTEKGLATIADLEAKGYEWVQSKNFFDGTQPWGEHPTYVGVNMQFKSPDGYRFELQFHTPESWDTKQNYNHYLLEESRALTTTEERRDELRLEMIALSDKVERPPDVGDIRSFKD